MLSTMVLNMGGKSAKYKCNIKVEYWKTGGCIHLERYHLEAIHRRKSKVHIYPPWAKTYQNGPFLIAFHHKTKVYLAHEDKMGQKSSWENTLPDGIQFTESEWIDWMTSATKNIMAVWTSVKLTRTVINC